MKPILAGLRCECVTAIELKWKKKSVLVFLVRLLVNSSWLVWFGFTTVIHKGYLNDTVVLTSAPDELPSSSSTTKTAVRLLLNCRPFT
jgi:hypothetical protein